MYLIIYVTNFKLFYDWRVPERLQYFDTTLTKCQIINYNSETVHSIFITHSQKEDSLNIILDEF